VNAPPEREENSGVINLAALQSGGASEQRTSEAPPDVAPAGDPGWRAEASHAALAAAAISDGSASERGATQPAARASGRGATGWIAVVGVAAAAAAAAVAFVNLRHTTQSRPDAPVAMAPANAQSLAKPQGGPLSSPAQLAAAANADRAIDPSKLPRAQPPAGARNPPAAVAGNAPGRARALGAPPPAAPNASSERATEPAPPAPGGDKSLEALMQEAAGTPATAAPQPTTAQAAAPGPAGGPAAGSVPLRPSLGAINGAIGTAMPGARACIDVDAPVSHATITFDSDGTVGNVAITGWAAGKPAEGCIRAALGKARVPPFAQPTYTVPATIRSN